MNYANHFPTKVTPQTQPIPGVHQVRNSAGGYVYELDKWKRLTRFLILGCENGTYYASEKQLTVENARCITDCILEDGVRVVGEIVDISDKARAPKNDPAIFALALVCAVGNQQAKNAAYSAIHKVCRIGTHLFQFCDAIQKLRGWSRGLRTGVGKFYSLKQPHQLENQLLKYKQRNGWTHKDVLRLAHPKPVSPAHEAMYRLTVGKDIPKLPPKIYAATALHDAAQGKRELSELQVQNLITSHNLTREMVPTELLAKEYVWKALLLDMPMTALIRNLGKMTAVGLLKTNMDQATDYVVMRLKDREGLKAARVHPMAILLALRTYAAGRGDKGSLTWQPVGRIVDALNEAFYLAFDAVEPTNKNICIGLDVSGSMGMGNIAGSSLTPREAACALTMVTARTEPKHHVFAFSDTLISIGISPGARLDQLCKDTASLPFSRTDCALPIIAADKMGVKFDAFVILTDNETWCGNIHPSQALRLYRNKYQVNAKLIVIGITATNFTIADPNDPGMLDVVGFDSSVPSLMREFMLE